MLRTCVQELTAPLSRPFGSAFVLLCCPLTTLQPLFTSLYFPFRSSFALSATHQLQPVTSSCKTHHYPHLTASLHSACSFLRTYFVDQSASHLSLTIAAAAQLPHPAAIQLPHPAATQPELLNPQTSLQPQFYGSSTCNSQREQLEHGADTSSSEKAHASLTEAAQHSLIGTRILALYLYP